jgi:uncharacterized protein (TIGR02145 family)
MTVNPLMPVSVAIAVSGNPVCQGTSVTLNASPVNGGSTPSFQWKLNGGNINGATDAAYSYVPVNNDQLVCILTSGETCPSGSPAASNTVSMTVNPLMPVGISITASTNSVCAGTSVLFSATAVNGGLSASYQWSVDGVPQTGATNATYSYIPGTNESVTCNMVSNEFCATGNPAVSNAVVVTVFPTVPVSVTVFASANPVCSGTAVTYTALPVNGGASPGYQWRVNGLIQTGATNSTFIYTPVDNDAIICEVNSNAICPGGNPAVSPAFISSIGSPVVTYAVCHDVETSTNAKPFKLRGGLPLGGVYSGTGVNSITGVFDPLVAGAGNHLITYTYTASTGCVVSSLPVTITNHSAVSVDCLSPTAEITDIRDGRVYPIVQIGSQCWMARNLDYGIKKTASESQTDNCVNDKYCLDNLGSNCTLYGGMYQWDELMQHDPISGGQGLCPPGWHVPTDSEWLTLFNYYAGQSEAGTALKDQGTGSFHVLPGGVLYQNNPDWSFSPPGFSATFFWTSDPSGQWQAKSHGLNSAVGSVSDYISGRENAFSVRCLRD